MALSEIDLPLVLNELFSARPKWYFIGLQLGLEISTLDSIRTEFQENVDKCFCQILIVWLQSSSKDKTWSRLVDVLNQQCVECGNLASKIEEKFCQPQPQVGEKRPHPDERSELAPKGPRLECGCNCQELKKLLQAYDQHIQELNTRLNHLETHQYILTRTRQKENDDLKKENAKLKCEYRILEKQIKEHSEQIQQLTIQLEKEKESTPKLHVPLTETNEIDDNILWMCHALWDVRDDWYRLGIEFQVGLSFLDYIKSKHSKDSTTAYFWYFESG